MLVRQGIKTKSTRVLVLFYVLARETVPAYSDNVPARAIIYRPFLCNRKGHIVYVCMVAKNTGYGNLTLFYPPTCYLINVIYKEPESKQKMAEMAARRLLEFWPCRRKQSRLFGPLQTSTLSVDIEHWNFASPLLKANTA